MLPSDIANVLTANFNLPVYCSRVHSIHFYNMFLWHINLFENKDDAKTPCIKVINDGYCANEIESLISHIYATQLRIYIRSNIDVDLIYASDNIHVIII